MKIDATFDAPGVQLVTPFDGEAAEKIGPRDHKPVGWRGGGGPWNTIGGPNRTHCVVVYSFRVDQWTRKRRSSRPRGCRGLSAVTLGDSCGARRAVSCDGLADSSTKHFPSIACWLRAGCGVTSTVHINENLAATQTVMQKMGSTPSVHHQDHMPTPAIFNFSHFCVRVETGPGSGAPGIGNRKEKGKRKGTKQRERSTIVESNPSCGLPRHADSQRRTDAATRRPRMKMRCPWRVVGQLSVREDWGDNPSPDFRKDVVILRQRQVDQDAWIERTLPSGRRRIKGIARHAPEFTLTSSGRT